MLTLEQNKTLNTLLLDLKTLVTVSSSIEEPVNIFSYEGIDYKITASTAEQMYKRICCLSVKDEQTIIKKQYTLNSLKPAIKRTIDKLNNYNFSKYSVTDVMLQNLLSVMLKDNSEDLTSIISSYIASAMLENVWSTFNNKPKALFMCSFVGLASNIGSACLGRYFEASYKDLHKNVRKHFEKLHIMPDSKDFQTKFYEYAATHLKEKAMKFNVKSKRLNFKIWLSKAHFLKLYETAPDKPDFIKKVYGPFKNFEEIHLEYKKEFSKLSVKIGSFFIDGLLENKILKETTYQRTSYLTLEEEFIEDIVYASSYYKPILYSNMPSIQTKFVDIAETYRINLINQNVQNNKRNKFTYDITNKLQKSIDTHDMRCTINKPLLDLYKPYLDYIYSLSFKSCLNDKTSQTTKDIIDFIYLHFEIDFSTFILEKNSQNKQFIKDILCFIGDREKITNNKLNKSLLLNYKKAYKDVQKEYNETDIKLKKRNSLNSFIHQHVNPKLESLIYEKDMHYKKLNVYYKIASKKYLLHNFYYDAVLFSHFSYFIITRGIVGSGRSNSNPTFLSYQTAKFIRGFILIVAKNTITKNSFKIYKKHLHTVLTNVEEKLNKLDYNTYILETQRLQEDYLIQFFKNKSKKELMALDTSSFKNMIQTLGSKSFKNIKTAFLGISILYYMQKPASYTEAQPVTFLDATSSGTQLLATAFCNKKAAKNSCLIGTTKFDINIFFLEGLNNFINSVYKIVEKFLVDFQLGFTMQNILTESFNNIEELLLKIEDEAIASWLKNNLTDKECTEILYYFYNKSTVLENQKQNREVILCYIKLSYSLKLLMKYEPWFIQMLKERSLIKKRIMADAYGMTPIGGTEAIDDSLKDYAIEHGYFYYNVRYIKIFSNIVAKYFMNVFRNDHLDYMINFQKSKYFAKYFKGPLHFSNEFITWSYAPRKVYILTEGTKYFNETKDEKGQQLTNKSKKRRFINIIYAMGAIDINKIKSAFCPLMIHSLEATLAEQLILDGHRLNDLLKSQGDSYNITTNYDCFGVPMKDIKILKLHLENGYNKLYKSKPINNILEALRDIGDPKQQKKATEYLLSLHENPLSDNYWDGIITHDSFVKF